jgi:hypothetical protein
MNGGHFPVLWCLAARRNNTEVTTWLREQMTQAKEPDCARVETPW